MPQDKFPLFSAKFGDRLRWLRNKRGLSQAEIADGSASTASSWEKDGKMPRGDKWEGISERLRLSWSFVSTGNPATSEDYDFIRENRNEIDFSNAPLVALDRLGASLSRYELGPEQSYILEEPDVLTAPGRLRKEIADHHAALMAAAGDDLARLGWVLIQSQTHLTAPMEWTRERTSTKEVVAPKKTLVGRAPAHQQNPVQPGKRSESDRASA